MYRLIGICIYLFISTASYAQSQFIMALKRNDIAAMSTTFQDKVSLSFDNMGEQYNKQEALTKMQEFMLENKVLAYSVSHSGNSPDKQYSFSIGTLKTEHKSYRIYIKYSHSGGRDSVSEIRIDP